jgi:NADH dehydrogenase
MACHACRDRGNIPKSSAGDSREIREMIIAAPRTYVASSLYARLSTMLAWVADAIDLLGRTSWPLVDLMIRISIGKLALISSVLISMDWPMAVSMAMGSYPIPVPSLQSTALLSSVYWLAAVSLIIGFATRFGASVLLAVAVASHIQVAALDLNLFWIALLAMYVAHGADRLSLDHLLSQGLKSSALPRVGSLITLLDATQPALTSIYLLALRVALMLTLLLAGGHMSPATALATAGIAAWLPLTSAQLFGASGIAVAVLIGGGLATRAAALIAVAMVGYDNMMAGDVSLPFYWTVLLLILVARGPGPASLDGLVLAGLRRWLPQLAGWPAFSLEGLPRVVIVGAGFGGIACARALRHAPVSTTLIDRQNHHLFQPLLYQVATAGLSPADIAIPIRAIFRDQFNATVILATVTGVDTKRREVLADGLSIPYDHLVIATGATHSYFGQDAWAPFAPGLKRVDDATFIRRRVLEAFEHAEVAVNEDDRRRLLNFVVVGGGPTGVELAGAIAELARVGMEKDFRTFDPATSKVILVERGPRLLPSFPESLSEVARRSLAEIGVEVLLNSAVRVVDADGVVIGDTRIRSRTVLWAAGVAASPAAKWLNADADNAGRVKVHPDLSVPDLPDVYVIGDTANANCWKGRPVPGLAPAAKQAGAFVAKVIRAKLRGEAVSHTFAYRHLGSLATIGRKSAVADFGSVRLHGVLAWWLWGVVHVLFLLGTRNRVAVALNWIWYYVTYRASTRLITGTSPTDLQPKSENARAGLPTSTDSSERSGHRKFHALIP